jgi:hypothetical protein
MGKHVTTHPRVERDHLRQAGGVQDALRLHQGQWAEGVHSDPPAAFRLLSVGCGLDHDALAAHLQRHGYWRSSDSTRAISLLWPRARSDGFWGEWRGPNDERPPRKLTQGELARLLRPFQIRARTIWPPQRRPGDRSKRGYLRSQFEAAWRAYCASPARRHRLARSYSCHEYDPSRVCERNNHRGYAGRMTNDSCYSCRHRRVNRDDGVVTAV